MEDFIEVLKEIGLWFFLPVFAFSIIFALSEAIKNLFKKEEKEYINVTVGGRGKRYPDVFYKKLEEARQRLLKNDANKKGKIKKEVKSFAYIPNIEDMTDEEIVDFIEGLR